MPMETPQATPADAMAMVARLDKALDAHSGLDRQVMMEAERMLQGLARAWEAASANTELADAALALQRSVGKAYHRLVDVERGAR